MARTKVNSSSNKKDTGAKEVKTEPQENKAEKLSGSIDELFDSLEKCATADEKIDCLSAVTTFFQNPNTFIDREVHKDVISKIIVWCMDNFSNKNEALSRAILDCLAAVSNKLGRVFYEIATPLLYHFINNLNHPSSIVYNDVFKYTSAIISSSEFSEIVKSLKDNKTKLTMKPDTFSRFISLMTLYPSVSGGYVEKHKQEYIDCLQEIQSIYKEYNKVNSMDIDRILKIMGADVEEDNIPKKTCSKCPCKHTNTCYPVTHHIIDGFFDFSFSNIHWNVIAFISLILFSIVTHEAIYHLVTLKTDIEFNNIKATIPSLMNSSIPTEITSSASINDISKSYSSLVDDLLKNTEQYQSLYSELSTEAHHIAYLYDNCNNTNKMILHLKGIVDVNNNECMTQVVSLKEANDLLEEQQKNYMNEIEVLKEKIETIQLVNKNKITEMQLQFDRLFEDNDKLRSIEVEYNEYKQKEEEINETTRRYQELQIKIKEAETQFFKHVVESIEETQLFAEMNKEKFEEFIHKNNNTQIKEYIEKKIQDIKIQTMPTETEVKHYILSILSDIRIVILILCLLLSIITSLLITNYKQNQCIQGLKELL
ncbi:hypothetical protein WA158_003296 [Blastocystis sp. Blastoise]